MEFKVVGRTSDTITSLHQTTLLQLPRAACTKAVGLKRSICSKLCSLYNGLATYLFQNQPCQQAGVKIWAQPPGDPCCNCWFGFCHASAAAPVETDNGRFRAQPWDISRGACRGNGTLKNSSTNLKEESDTHQCCALASSLNFNDIQLVQVARQDTV